MNTFLLAIGIIVLVSGGICLIISDETLDDVISAVLMIFGIGFFIMSLSGGSDEVYKLTITDTKTNEVTYEIVTEIEERESYLKYTDEDGNVHSILMEDKEILKEEFE